MCPSIQQTFGFPPIYLQRKCKPFNIAAIVKGTQLSSSNQFKISGKKQIQQYQLGSKNEPENYLKMSTCYQPGILSEAHELFPWELMTRSLSLMCYS